MTLWERTPTMMRKDVKLGFGIGGILVAVLVAVALVSGPKGNPKSGADLAAGDTTSTDQTASAPDRPVTPADVSAARSAEGPAPAPGDRTGSDAFGPSGAGSLAVAQAGTLDANQKVDPTE